MNVPFWIKSCSVPIDICWPPISSSREFNGKFLKIPAIVLNESENSSNSFSLWPMWETSMFSRRASFSLIKAGWVYSRQAWEGDTPAICVGRDVCYRIMLDTTVCLSDRKFTKPTVKYRTHGKTYRLYSIHLFQFLIKRKQRKGATPYFYCIFVMVCTGFD